MEGRYQVTYLDNKMTTVFLLYESVSKQVKPQTLCKVVLEGYHRYFFRSQS